MLALAANLHYFLTVRKTDQVVHALGKHFAPQAQAQGDSGNLKGNGPAYERPDA